MGWNIATAEEKTGTPAGTQDDLLQMMMDRAVAIAERYCDRGLIYKEETIYYYDIQQRVIQLKRYPLLGLAQTTPANLPPHHVHKLGGQIIFHNEPFFDQLGIVYYGGYLELPPDLEMALWDIFHVLWETYGPNAGGGGPTIALGAVKKKTIVGVGSIEYETGGSSASTEKSAADLSALMPGATMALLEPYRLYSA